MQVGSGSAGVCGAGRDACRALTPDHPEGARRPARRHRDPGSPMRALDGSLLPPRYPVARIRDDDFGLGDGCAKWIPANRHGDGEAWMRRPRLREEKVRRLAPRKRARVSKARRHFEQATPASPVAEPHANRSAPGDPTSCCPIANASPSRIGGTRPGVDPSLPDWARGRPGFAACEFGRGVRFAHHEGEVSAPSARKPRKAYGLSSIRHIYLTDCRVEFGYLQVSARRWRVGQARVGAWEGPW